jgi:hypothetical protein
MMQLTSGSAHSTTVSARGESALAFLDQLTGGTATTVAEDETCWMEIKAGGAKFGHASPRQCAR